jgi:hypothetical protein
MCATCSIASHMTGRHACGPAIKTSGNVPDLRFALTSDLSDSTGGRRQQTKRGPIDALG